MASAFVEDCLALNIIPHWDSFSDNYASIRVAEKVGFEKNEIFDIYFGNFSKSIL